MNPIYRPFAGKPTMYLAVNLGMVPLDIWLIKRPKSRRAKAVAAAAVASNLVFASRNLYMHNRDWRTFCVAQYPFNCDEVARRLRGLVPVAGAGP